MKIHEYQAKEILRKYNIPLPQGNVAFSVEEALNIAKKFPSEISVVKAQIHAGGRGKGGGVKVCKNLKELEENAEKILGMNLVTPQTSKEGQRVSKVLVEQGVAIKKELYLSILVDRESRMPVVLASTEGGMDIEEVAAKTPEKIVKQKIEPVYGMRNFYVRNIAFALGLHKIDAQLPKKIGKILRALYLVFMETDATLLEINPLIITKQNEIMPLDCKISFDDNAIFRHPERDELRDLSEENQAEIKAKEFDLNFIKLEGTIGCMVNGAGLAMATMDIIQHYGGSPANFLDVGGGTNEEKVETAFRIISEDKNVKSILVNIFGGIVRCDLIAEGILKAFSKTNILIPIVIRLEGTNAEKAKEILENSNYQKSLMLVNGFAEATKKAIELAN